MKKYKVFLPCDRMDGYLRYGHFEGIIEADSVQGVLERLNDYDRVYELLDLEIDDYRINSYEINFEEISVEEIND